jgi:hypothetical protein
VKEIEIEGRREEEKREKIRRKVTWDITLTPTHHYWDQ